MTDRITGDPRIATRLGWVGVPEACRLLGKSHFTLQRWRSEGKGPRHSKNGHTVIYRLKDLELWLEKNLSPASGEMPETGSSVDSAESDWCKKHNEGRS